MPRAPTWRPVGPCTAEPLAAAAEHPVGVRRDPCAQQEQPRPTAGGGARDELLDRDAGQVGDRHASHAERDHVRGRRMRQHEGVVG